jgi:hypothetical protein
MAPDVPGKAPTSDEPQEWAARTAVLSLLDRQRAISDAAMWQAPTITIAAQAFLLQILANQEIDWWAR